MKRDLFIQSIAGALAATVFLFAANAFAADGNDFASREKLTFTLSTEGNEVWAPEFVDGLTDNQVRELNQALNNAEKSGLTLDFDQEVMQRIIDENLNKHGIRALTLALEKEALFFDKYEKTGDEKFLIKAEAEKEKFLARIDGSPPPPASTDASTGTGQTLAIKQVKEASREARKAGRDAAREARKAAREAARNAVKEAAKGGKKG